MLDDQQFLQQSIQMFRNPSIMRELMRNTDRAMSSIENVQGVGQTAYFVIFFRDLKHCIVCIKRYKLRCSRPTGRQVQSSTHFPGRTSASIPRPGLICSILTLWLQWCRWLILSTPAHHISGHEYAESTFFNVSSNKRCEQVCSLSGSGGDGQHASVFYWCRISCPHVQLNHYAGKFLMGANKSFTGHRSNGGCDATHP